MNDVPPAIIAAQEELARIGAGLSAFHAIAADCDHYPADVRVLASDVATLAVRLGLTRAAQLLAQIETASSGG